MLVSRFFFADSSEKLARPRIHARDLAVMQYFPTTAVDMLRAMQGADTFFGWPLFAFDSAL
jgi:hypothetical protein